MTKLFLPFTIALFVVACGPRDVANSRNGGGFNQQGTGGGSGNAKLAFVVEDDGERAETCPTKNQDYKNIIISEDDLPGALDGTVTAVIEPGNRNCFRIGSTVQVKTDFSSDEVQGDAIIVKTEGVALSKLAKKHAEAFGLTVSELKARGQELIDAVEAQKKFRPEGMVNITYFKMEGSGNNSPAPSDVAVSTSIFTKVGDRPTSCTSKSKWTRISIPVEQDENIKSGKVIAWYSLGASNCFEVGSQIQVKEKDGPARAELKVTRIEVVPATQVGALHALSTGLEIDELRKMASEEEAGLNIIFFEFISAPAPVAAQ